MRQKKFGAKVQNWHRPLGREELRRRFLRDRHADPEPEDEADYYYAGHDEYWNGYDPCCDETALDDLTRFKLDQFLTAVLDLRSSDLPPPLFRLEWAAANPSEKLVEAARPCENGDRLSGTEIEKRLANYIGEVRRCSESLRGIRDLIGDSVRDLHDVETLRTLRLKTRYPRFVNHVLLFSPFWLRPPMRRSGEDEVSLLKHLFVRHDVPEFLYREWFREEAIPRFKWLCWFILLGQGGSLKRAAEHFAWDLPNRFPHFLRDAPSDSSPTEACLFAEVKRLGGSERDFRRVMANPAFVIDPTEISATESHAQFWRETIRWLIAHGNAITDDECELILGWAMHEYTEAEQSRRRFSWKGRRVRAVLDKSRQYRREVERPWSNYRWQKHGWDWQLEDPIDGKWLFVELISGEDLYAEGREMHHCVASYAARCAGGFSAIVSIRHNDMQRLTVEIHPRTRQVIQARGAYNRPVNAKEKVAISRWLKDVVRSDA
jgi:hypothetical protein